MSADADTSALRALLDARVARWGGRLRVLPDGAFNARSVITALPRAVADLYPAFPRAALGEVTVALCLFSDAVVSCDDVIDYAKDDPASVRRLPGVVVLFTEAYRTFAELYGGAPRFWDRVARYFGDYVDALAAEARCAAGERAWAACTPDECLAIARGKNGLVRIVDAAIAALPGGDDDPRGIDEILLQCFVANQMLDDLRDWREDLRDGNVSLLLRRVSDQRPGPEDGDAIGRAIYAGGHAAHVLDVAHANLSSALRSSLALRAEALAGLIRPRIGRIEALRGRLARELVPAS